MSAQAGMAGSLAVLVLAMAPPAVAPGAPAPAGLFEVTVLDWRAAAGGEAVLSYRLKNISPRAARMAEAPKIWLQAPGGGQAAPAAQPAGAPLEPGQSAVVQARFKIVGPVSGLLAVVGDPPMAFMTLPDGSGAGDGDV